MLKGRDELSPEFKWRLEDLYENDQVFENSFAALQEAMKKVPALEGTLLSSSEALLRALEFTDDLSRRGEKLYVYACMRRDEDNARTQYQSMADRAMSLLVQLESETSFITPELTSADSALIEKYISEQSGLSVYAHSLRDLQRQKPHVLSKDQEHLLAMAGDMASGAQGAFKMLNNADLKFSTVVDDKGAEVEITHGRYSALMEVSDRRVRKETFEKYYAGYQYLPNTLAALYNASVKKDVFYAKARGFDSALEGSLFSDNVPMSVYDELIERVHANLPAMYKYVALRKRALGLDELHMYDLYTPIVQDIEYRVPYDQAKAMVLGGIAPMGKEYSDKVAESFTTGWIDVYENRGKTSGAYSWGHYDTHPYILLNYQDTIDHVFTLAHEMGHAMHSYLADQAQPYATAGYPILLAEVASTVNESLLMDKLLEAEKDAARRKFLLNHQLEQFRGTVYRQVMFAEFEKKAHAEVERGGALTLEWLCKIYRELNELYYGPDMVIDSQIDLEWARIPHFYNAFYVYKYATGFSSAVAISEDIKARGEAAAKGYIDCLRSGGNDYPLNILKKAGVDLTTGEAVDKSLAKFARIVDEMEGYYS